MKILKITFVLILFFSAHIFSQSLSIGLGSGLNFINGNNYYTDNFGRLGIYENINGTTTNLTGLGLSRELQFKFGAKYSFENLPLSLTAGLNYLHLRGNESMYIYDVFMQREFLKDVTTKMDIWSFQMGTNYFFSFYFLKPFVAASVSINYFDDVFIELAETDYTSEFRSYKNGMRYGYSLGMGISYNIFSNIELEFSTNYNSWNVFHRREAEEMLNSVNALVNIYYKIL
ncbi:MAG: opacity family porin [Bacteroidota bacterium]|nr:opacity family porin [Bacteroidota bacterium]